MKTKYLKILRGVNSTTESDPVFFTPQSQLTQISQKTPRCASYHNVHPSVESSSVMCIIPRSQTAHGRVWIKNLTGLWLLLKGQSGKILLGVNTSIMKEKIWSIKVVLLNTRFTPRCYAHRWVEFFELWDRIIWRNRNPIPKYFTLFIRCPDWFKTFCLQNDVFLLSYEATKDSTYNLWPFANFYKIFMLRHWAEKKF